MSENLEINKNKREWKFYLDDMIGFAEKILAYTEGYDLYSFQESELNY